MTLRDRFLMRPLHVALYRSMLRRFRAQPTRQHTASVPYDEEGDPCV